MGLLRLGGKAANQARKSERGGLPTLYVYFGGDGISALLITLQDKFIGVDMAFCNVRNESLPRLYCRPL